MKPEGIFRVVRSTNFGTEEPLEPERSLVSLVDFKEEELLPLSFFGEIQLLTTVESTYSGANMLPSFPGYLHI